jgi:hypothetical protein
MELIRSLGLWADEAGRPRQIAAGAAVTAAVGLAAALAAGALGLIGAAIVLLPAAMIAYSAALAAAATAREHEANGVLEQATDRVRRAILGDTAALVGIAREQQAALQLGSAEAVRVAIELALEELQATPPAPEHPAKLLITGW